MQDTFDNVPFSAEIDRRFSPVYGQALNQMTCILPGGGCVYYRAHQGDVCPFCSFPGFSRHVVRGPGHEQDFSPWTLPAETFVEMYDRSVAAYPEFDKLAVFNGGSFFPQSELPNALQEHIYRDVASRPNVRQLMVEAYPTFITEAKLHQAKSLLGDVELMVGIGFESQNDFIRNTLLKKRIDKELFESKVRLMQDLGVQVFVYAFLKAPGLTERQSLDEALRTCAYLHDLGVDEIALSCAFVPPGSPLEGMYREGKFSPPWLWSILAIQEEAEKRGWPLSIGGFEDVPPPVAGPANCDRCTDDVLGLLDRARLAGKAPADAPQCGCKGRWRKLVGEV